MVGELLSECQEVGLPSRYATAELLMKIGGRSPRPWLFGPYFSPHSGFGAISDPECKETFSSVVTEFSCLM